MPPIRGILPPQRRAYVGWKKCSCLKFATRRPNRAPCASGVQKCKPPQILARRISWIACEKLEKLRVMSGSAIVFVALKDIRFVP